MAVTEKKLVLNSNGQAWRPHLHIDDVCEAFRRCIEWDYRGGKLMILNVGRNDNNHRILDVARMIQERVKGCTLSFLDQVCKLEGNETIRDRKIQDGVDTRTYQVSFDRIHQVLPSFKAKWSVQQGIDQLLEDLRRNKLDIIKFQKRDFYRLQQIEHLHIKNLINDNLEWIL